MYITPVDSPFILSKERRDLFGAYEEKFSEQFIQFNYADFLPKDGKCPGEVYMEALRKAVEADEPTRIVSHRYDVIDH